MRKTILVACLLVCSLALDGCNAGLGGLLYALLSDKGGGSGNKKSGQNLATAEFVALEDARLDPAHSTIVLSLRSSGKRNVDLQVDFSDGGGAFLPASVSPPSPKVASRVPGSLLNLPASTTGTVHRIPWNALADLGNDDFHHVQLRFTGEINGPLLVDVVAGDDAPEIHDLSVSQRAGEDLSVGLVVSDSSGDPVDIAVEFAIDADEDGMPHFGPVHAIAGNIGLLAEPEGTPHAFAWNAVRDAGAFDRLVSIRLTPFDRIAGQVGKTGQPLVRMLELDNNRPPETELLDGDDLTDPDQRRGIAVRFVVKDLESNPVDAIVQWAAGDGSFPDLDPALDGDAAARAALLDDPSARRSLQIAAVLADPISGPVEQPPAGVTLASNAVLAAWIKAQGELRGLAGGDCAEGPCALVGRKVELLGSGGAENQTRTICGYSPETGILRVDSAFDPPAGPGATLRIDFGGAQGSLQLASSLRGVLHQFIWDGATDSPGGGSIRFRITPYDRVASAAAGCAAAPGSDAPGVGSGDRGSVAESGGAKRTRGPFAEGNTWALPLAPIDEPVSLAAVDVDGDGRMDVACAAGFSNTAVLLLQKRPGIFDSLRLTDVQLQGPTGLVAHDLDADGRADLAISDEVTGRVLVLYQEPGLDFFSRRLSLTAGGALRSPAGITAADLDGDGDIDLAVAEAGGPKHGVRIFFRGAGPAGCEEAEGGYRSCFLLDPNNEEPRAITSAKVTDDSVFDLVTAGDGFFAVYSLSLAGGELQFRYTRIDAPGTNLRSVAAADVDGNGRLDLVGADRAGRSVQIASQTSGFDFGLLAPLVSANLRGPLGIVEADLDGNGVTDFAVADPGDPATLLGGNVCVFLGDAAGRHSGDSLERKAGKPPTSSSPRAVAAADFDGDGRIDIASADGGSHEVVIFKQGGKGTFLDPATVLASGQSLPALSSLEAADWNGDGKVDLLAPGRESDSVTLLEQESAGTFAALTVALPRLEGTAKRGPVDAAAGDLNGDGSVDAVSANVDSNDLTVLLRDENGDFTAFDVGGDQFLGPQSVALADIDGDGKLDIVAAARFSDDARWFRQEASGGFTEGGAFRATAGSTPKILGPIFVAVGDLDRDGRVDVVTANHRSGNLTIFLQGDSNGTFVAPIEAPLGAGNRPVAIVMADLDGNGTLDLATANLGLAAASVFLQGSDGTLEPSSIAALAGVQPTAISARDLDGDDRRDLAVAFSGLRGSFVKIYFQAPGGVFSEARSVKVSSSAMSVPVQVLAVDLDGDGEADLATANRQSRNATVFFGGR